MIGMFELGFEGLGMMGRMGVVWERGVAVIFVHPLRVALRSHASPSQSEGEGRPPSVSFVGGEGTALLWEWVLRLWRPYLV